jgi:sugar phosphate isomerase/epimerase
MHYFLDDGTLDIKMIADVLKTIGFDGVLTIESAPGFVFPCAYPESDERILQTYKIWKECYGIDS